MPTEFGQYIKTVTGLGVRRLGLLISGQSADDATTPTLSAGTAAPTASEANGSLYMRTSGALYRRIGGAWEQALGAAGVLLADTISELTAAAGVTIDSLLIKDGKVDLNGVAGGLILDADGNTHIGASTDNQIDVTVSGAIDFQITANTLTAVSGSTIATNTIAETTAAAGVTVDGCLIKDGRAANLATAAIFFSGEQTGTGAPQNVAHGFAATPTLVVAIPSDLTGGAYAVAYGTHDATNAVLTVTTGEKFRVLAIR